MRHALAPCIAFAATAALSGCFGEVGFAAAKTATLQAQAAKNAVKTKDESIKKINDAMAVQAERNAKILEQAQQDSPGQDGSR